MADEEQKSTESGSEGKGARFDRAKEFVNEKYSAASENVKSKYDDVRGKVQDKYSEVKGKVDEIDFDDLTEQGRAYIRSNPGKALLLSLGVGFLIGLLLRRSDED